MIALLFLIGLTAVYGQHGHPHSCIHNNHQEMKEAQVVERVLADMDRDGDGFVLGEDITNEFLVRFDVDGVGGTSVDEFVHEWHRSYHDAHDFAGYLFIHFDTNRDNALTTDDLPAIAMEVDTNKDGQTSVAEFRAFLTKLYMECVSH